MSAHADRVRELFDQAAALPDGFSRVTLIEEAVRIADTHGDIPLAYEARQRLMEDAMDGGLPDRLLMAFAWCCGQSDRDPERFPEGDILWSYRWVINEAASFPSIPVEKIEELLDDMRARYVRCGSSLRPYYLLQKNLYNTLGSVEKARAAHKAWRAAPRDHMSDSPETELSFHVSYLLLLERYEDAVRAAKPILDGVYRSQHFEATERAEMILPLLKLGRTAEAAECYRRGYSLVATNPRFAFHAADHAAFLAITENAAAAAHLFAKHFPVAVASVDPLNRFNSWASLETVLDRLVRHGIEEVKVTGLPADFPVPSAEKRYPVRGLLMWCENEAEDLAANYDARNGTTHYAGELVKSREFRNLSLPYEVDVMRSPSIGAQAAHDRYLKKSGKWRIE